MDEKFTPGTGSWEAKLGFVRNAIRQELVSRQLSEHLPTYDSEVRILDVGCGQGTQVLRLASQGYQVIGVDPSKKLLRIGRQELAQQPAAVQERVQFRHGTTEDVADVVDHDFDVVCCHGVLMYLPELQAPISSLVELARPGGLLSVLTRNRASIAMRAGMTKDWHGAIDGFDARNYTNRLGLPDVRADDPEEVIDALKGNHAELIAWYGVRLFTDHWGDEQIPTNFEQILDAEDEAGRREPYKRLTSLTHVIARKTKEHGVSGE